MEHVFRTDAYTITATKHADGAWSNKQKTTLTIPGQSAPFAHTNRSTLHKTGAPKPKAYILTAKNPTLVTQTARYKEVAIEKICQSINLHRLI